MATVINGTTGIDKVQDGSVTSSKIVDGTIASGDMADGAVTLSKMAAGVIPAGVAKVSSNPLITTNGSIGDQWINTTTGEMFILKDATTNENIWKGQDGSTISPIVDVNFKTVLYTGNGSNGHSITGFGFQVDFAWIKIRNQPYSHNIIDSVRGATVSLNTELGAESAANVGLVSFDSDGFSTTTTGETNSNGQSYVAWCASLPNDYTTNNSGSIASTVKTNGWMSVVAYTGTATNATVGHNLDGVCEMMIVKRRNGTGGPWNVYHKAVGNTKSLQMQWTGTGYTSITRWNNTTPTNAVFTVGTDWEMNGNGDTFIAYAFTSVADKCKVGSYDGTGVAGLAIDCGFEPGWVMIKCSTDVRNWAIIDSVRGVDKMIYANSVATELTGRTEISSFSSTGFTIGNTDPTVNKIGHTYIYLAIAKQL
jgi:hypothetical protein